MIFRIVCLVALLVVCVGAPRHSAAHALDPGYLNVQQTNENIWRVFWRKPDVGGRPMPITPRAPHNCEAPPEPTPQFDGRAWVAQWQMLCRGPIEGGQIVIEGLEKTQTDVLIRVQYQDGVVVSSRVRADMPSFTIPAQPSSGAVFLQYLGFGYDHILEGWDHLLFVFALLVLVQSPKRLLGAITAFTLAHSITLAAAVLGFVNVPSAPVEAAIALSIVLLAVEILKQGTGKPYLTSSYPWIVAFLFGLLHGLGFAGALSEIGLPEGDIPLALLAFNLGVEAGQLAFVAAIVACFVLLRWLLPAVAGVLHRPGAVGTRALGYMIGSVSVWWLAERVSGF